MALGYATEPTAAERVVSSVIAGVAAALGALVVWARRGLSPWIRPLALYATGAHAGAIIVALRELPDRPLLVIALAAAGIELTALGILLRRPLLVYGGLPLLLASWLTFASEGLTGNPQWFTVPIGLTILALTETARWDLRRRGMNPSRREIQSADYLGIAFLVGAALLQTLTVSSGYGVIGIGIGLVVAVWGAATKVRHRVFAGAGTVVLSGLLMVSVPLAKVVQEFRGIWLWATVFVIGVVLIVIAATLERSRALVERTTRRINELMEGWE